MSMHIERHIMQLHSVSVQLRERKRVCEVSECALHKVCFTLLKEFPYMSANKEHRKMWIPHAAKNGKIPLKTYEGAEVQ